MERHDDQSVWEEGKAGIPSETTAGSAFEEAEKTEEPPFKVFQTREEYQTYFDKIMGQRLKSARKNAEKLEKLTPLLSALQQEYGAQSEEQLFDLLAQGAKVPQGQEERRQSQIADTLQHEVEKIAQQDSLYEKLDAKQLAADQKFMALLAQGFSVKDAYDALHLQEVTKELAKRAGKQIVDNIMARGNRPSENALTGGSAGAFVPNVAAMSNDEIDALLERVQKGESISF